MPSRFVRCLFKSTTSTMASPTSIPLFPPWCVMPPVEKKCTLLGVTMPCVALPVNDDLFGREISLGHWVTTFSLIAIGIINLSYVSFPFQRADTMKIITSFYAIGTGIFSWLRLYFGVGHFLLMAAALHNLGEWSMLMMIAAFHKTVWEIERSILYLTFYTVAMIGFIMMMPTLLVAGVVEQLAGITVDFGLAFIFLYTYLTNANKPEVRSFYFYPALAHTVHLFFTILPLVFANFHVGFTSWYNSFFLETSVYVSSPITHILYMVRYAHLICTIIYYTHSFSYVYMCFPVLCRPPLYFLTPFLYCQMTAIRCVRC